MAQRLRADTVFTEPYAPDFNIAPTTFQPILRLTRDSEERELVLARWGLIPYFAKSLADFKGFSTFNARAESLTRSPTWRGPLERRRCLIPADGFYEWKQDVDNKGSKRQPYAITLKHGEAIAFAGLWDAWREPQEGSRNGTSWLQSFAIITTEANELMATIHTRMPVILRQRDWPRWLERNPDVPPPIDLLRPFDSDAMQLAACNPMVGNVRNNGPELLNTGPELNSA